MDLLLIVVILLLLFGSGGFLGSRSLLVKQPRCLSIHLEGGHYA